MRHYREDHDPFSWSRLRFSLIIGSVFSILLAFTGPQWLALLCQSGTIFTSWFSGIHLLCTAGARLLHTDEGVYISKPEVMPKDAWKLTYGYFLFFAALLGSVAWFLAIIFIHV